MECRVAINIKNVQNRIKKVSKKIGLESEITSFLLENKKVINRAKHINNDDDLALFIFSILIFGI